MCALFISLINSLSYQLCNSDPVLDPPTIRDQTVVNYILKKKTKATSAYQRFEALNKEENTGATAKLYLKAKPDLTQSDPL